VEKEGGKLRIVRREEEERGREGGNIHPAILSFAPSKVVKKEKGIWDG